jgi:hypothetical protein
MQSQDQSNPKPAEAPAISAVGQKLRVEYWPVGRLKPYERNPRKNDKAVDRIRESIRQFGFAVPILAKSDGEVIDGHLGSKAPSQRRFVKCRWSPATAGPTLR